MSTQARYSTGGLFGPSPDEIEQAQRQQADAAAMNYGRMSQDERNSSAMYRAGGLLMKPIMTAMGREDPQISRAKKIQSVVGQIDTETSAGLLDAARKFNEMGLSNEAQIAFQKANELKKQEAAAALAQQKETRAQQRLEEIDKQRMQNDYDVKIMMLENSRERDRATAESRAATVEQREAASKRADATDRYIANLQAEMKKLGVAAKSSTSGSATSAKPKGLTREAGLKWELENGMIDQATYDAAISASPGGVLRQKQGEAASTAETGFASVERNIEQLYDAKTGKLKPASESLFGQYAQYRPEITMSQETVDAKLALEGLTDQVMMANLADAKARVGQSFGSMQVQEWDKFTQQLTSLKRGLSEEQAAKSMKYVLDFIKNKRNVLKAAMGTANPIQVERGASTAAPIYATNGKVRIMSTDGGKTWKPAGEK